MWVRTTLAAERDWNEFNDKTLAAMEHWERPFIAHAQQARETEMRVVVDSEPVRVLKGHAQRAQIS